MQHRISVFYPHHANPVLAQLKTSPPLVHCLTNQVVQSITANVLLALGASPAMVVSRREVESFCCIADSLLVNLGTLHEQQAEAILKAVKMAQQHAIPWVLDPVAVGHLAFRTEFAQQLLSYQPTAIRGNASEIMALAGEASSGRGVDSGDHPEQALQAAQWLATQFKTRVAVTGEIDYITDGSQTYEVVAGDALMTRVVGTGCALSAVVAAFLALKGDPLTLIASACWVMAEAGERAVALSQGPGTFVPHFLDNLYQIATTGEHDAD